MQLRLFPLPRHDAQLTPLRPLPLLLQPCRGAQGALGAPRGLFFLTLGIGEAWQSSDDYLMVPALWSVMMVIWWLMVFDGF